MVKPPPLGADVMEVLERWRPTKWTESDLRILEPLLPTIRGWVERMGLPDADQTRRFLLAASAIAVWALRSFGNADPSVVFHPSNVEAWSMTVRADKSLQVAASYSQQTPCVGKGRERRGVAAAHPAGEQTCRRPPVRNSRRKGVPPRLPTARSGQPLPATVDR